MAQETPAPNEKDFHNAVTALREEIEKKTVDPAKIEAISKVLDSQEEFNQKALTDFKGAEAREKELKERLDVLEVELARGGGAGDTKNYRDSDEYKAVRSLVLVGEGEMDREVKALLRTDSDVAGGYLVQGEMDNMITKKITEISGIRSIARVRTIGSKSLSVPVRSAILSAAYEGEAELGTDDTSTYSNETLTAFRQTVTVPITQDMLMDSSFDMEGEIFGDASEAFAQGEGTNFVLGSGVKRPTGFLTDTRVPFRTSTTTSTVDAEDVILLTGDLKVGYNPTYVMSRGTLAFLRTLKATTGAFLWQPGMNGPVANTINGFPYILAQDMPAIASNSLSISFGDFQRGYTIVDRTGVSIVRDEFTQKKKAIIEFTINRWNTGQVTLPEAIINLKTAA